MKTLRFLGMAIVAVMLSAFATSCDDDDDDDNSQPATSEDGVVVNQKKLVKSAWIDVYDDNIWSGTTLYSYDSKGRLIRAEIFGGNTKGATEREVKTFVWENDRIIRCDDEDGTIRNYTYTLSDNLVTEAKREDSSYAYSTRYEYDSEKRLVSSIEQEGSRYYPTYLTWEDDKVVREGDEDDESVYYYRGKTCKGYCPSVAFGGDLGYAHPELFGCRIRPIGQIAG